MVRDDNDAAAAAAAAGGGAAITRCGTPDYHSPVSVNIQVFVTLCVVLSECHHAGGQGCAGVAPDGRHRPNYGTV